MPFCSRVVEFLFSDCVTWSVRDANRAIADEIDRSVQVLIPPHAHSPALRSMWNTSSAATDLNAKRTQKLNKYVSNLNGTIQSKLSNPTK